MGKSSLMHGMAALMLCISGASAAHAQVPALEDHVGLRSDAQLSSQAGQKESMHGDAADAAPLGNLRSDITSNVRSAPAKRPSAGMRRH